MRALALTEAQRVELEAVAKSHPKPYMREKARALLLVHRGIPGSVVAQAYLIPSRDPDTVYSWMTLYETSGVEALVIKKGRGRKPAFSPSATIAASSPGGAAGCAGS